MTGADVYVEESKGTAVLRIRVSPRSSRTGVKPGATALAVAVRAPAEKGKATEEALRAVADFLGVPRSAVALAGGAASRDKRVAVERLTPSDLRKRVSERLATLF